MADPRADLHRRTRTAGGAGRHELVRARPQPGHPDPLLRPAHPLVGPAPQGPDRRGPDRRRAREASITWSTSSTTRRRHPRDRPAQHPASDSRASTDTAPIDEVLILLMVFRRGLSILRDPGEPLAADAARPCPEGGSFIQAIEARVDRRGRRARQHHPAAAGRPDGVGRSAIWVKRKRPDLERRRSRARRKWQEHSASSADHARRIAAPRRPAPRPISIGAARRERCPRARLFESAPRSSKISGRPAAWTTTAQRGHTDTGPIAVEGASDGQILGA